MKILFAKSKWEMWDDPLEDFLKRAYADGFDAVEIYLPALSETPREIKDRVDAYGLKLIAQITTEGRTPCDHMASLKARFDFAAQTDPLFVNGHTGSDFFSFAENVRILKAGCELERESGIKFTQETHRGRALFTLPATRDYLKLIPALRLNADFSHWFCVHESDLSNQPEHLEAAIQHSYHIHARVGHSEGSQVVDPLSPDAAEFTSVSISYWRRILDARRREGCPWLTLTPEFGPSPYMPTDPKSGAPLADPWETNVRFLSHLKEKLL